MIERLEGEFKKEGASIEQVQKIDRRNFSYVAGPLDSGYYVNFIFQGEPPILDRLRAKFKLDGDVYRQQYVCVPVKKEHVSKAGRASKAAAKA